MNRERTLFVGALVVAALIVGALVLAPDVREGLAPKPVAAWVAIQPQGAEVARTGRVELAAGSPFTLHAVLEARDRQGEPVYYTEAPRLVIGGEEVPRESLRRWDRDEEVRVLWFTVEGEVPFAELQGEEPLERLAFEEFFRADWPQSWSAPGALEPRHDDHLRRAREQKTRPFGTQRFQARIELFGPESRMLPRARFSSWGAEEVVPRAEQFPTVVAALAGPAGPASRVFGLTQLEPPEGASPELLARLAELTRRELAFSTPVVLRQMLRAAERGDLAALAWREASLDGALAWEREAHPGDLLRSGGDVAVLYRDLGRPGVVDPEDLALTFERGAVVLPLQAIFPSGLPVEWAPLGGAAEPAGVKQSAPAPAEAGAEGGGAA